MEQMEANLQKHDELQVRGEDINVLMCMQATLAAMAEAKCREGACLLHSKKPMRVAVGACCFQNAPVVVKRLRRP